MTKETPVVRIKKVKGWLLRWWMWDNQKHEWMEDVLEVSTSESAIERSLKFHINHGNEYEGVEKLPFTITYKLPAKPNAKHAKRAPKGL